MSAALVTASLVSISLAVICIFAGTRSTVTHYQPPQLAVTSKAVFFIDGRVSYRQRDTLWESATLAKPLWQRCTTSSPASCTTIAKPQTLNSGEALVLSGSLRGRFIRAIGRGGGFTRATAVIRVPISVGRKQSAA